MKCAFNDSASLVTQTFTAQRFLSHNHLVMMSKLRSALQIIHLPSVFHVVKDGLVGKRAKPQEKAVKEIMLAAGTKVLATSQEDGALNLNGQTIRKSPRGLPKLGAGKAKRHSNKAQTELLIDIN